MSEKKNPKNLELICSSVDVKEEPLKFKFNRGKMICGQL